MDSILHAENVLCHDRIPPMVCAELGLRLLNALSPGPDVRPLDIVDQALALCDQHDGSFLGVEELADILHVSRTTLFREFHKRFGQSPKWVLDEIRLERAKALLRSSATNIKTISSICGYRNEAYFNRAFKRQIGMPPGAWRRKGE